MLLSVMRFTEFVEALKKDKDGYWMCWLIAQKSEEKNNTPTRACVPVASGQELPPVSHGLQCWRTNKICWTNLDE